MRARSIIAASGVKDAGGVQPPSQWFEGAKSGAHRVILGTGQEVFGGSELPDSFTIYIAAQYYNFPSGQHHGIYGNQPGSVQGALYCRRDRYSGLIQVEHRDNNRRIAVSVTQPGGEDALFLNHIVYRYDINTLAGTIRVHDLEDVSSAYNVLPHDPIPEADFGLCSIRTTTGEISDAYFSNFAVWYSALTDQQITDLSMGTTDPREMTPAPDVGVLLDGDLSVYAGSLPNIRLSGTDPQFVAYSPNPPP